MSVWNLFHVWNKFKQLVYWLSWLLPLLDPLRLFSCLVEDVYVGFILCLYINSFRMLLLLRGLQAHEQNKLLEANRSCDPSWRKRQMEGTGAPQEVTSHCGVALSTPAGPGHTLKMYMPVLREIPSLYANVAKSQTWHWWHESRSEEVIRSSVLSSQARESSRLGFKSNLYSLCMYFCDCREY